MHASTTPNAMHPRATIMSMAFMRECIETRNSEKRRKICAITVPSPKHASKTM